MDTVDTRTLRELVRAGSVRRVRAMADGNGYKLALRCGDADRMLEAAKGHIRRFRALDSVASYLAGIGVVSFEVDVRERHSRKRPSGRRE